jgi:hypothetical protein
MPTGLIGGLIRNLEVCRQSPLFLFDRQKATESRRAQKIPQK